MPSDAPSLACQKCGSRRIGVQAEPCGCGIEYFVHCEACDAEGPRVWRYGSYSRVYERQAIGEWRRCK